MPERRYGAGAGHPTGWTLQQLRDGWEGMVRQHVAVCCFDDFMDEIELHGPRFLKVLREIAAIDDTDSESFPCAITMAREAIKDFPE